MKRIAILLLLSALALPVAAQDYQVPEIEISKDKVLVDGKPFFAHVVTAKQTLFSISKAYGVTVRDIIEANQKLDLEKRGLKTGDVLFTLTYRPSSRRLHLPCRSRLKSRVRWTNRTWRPSPAT